MIKNIIFDLGRVLVSFDPTEKLKALGLHQNDIDCIVKGIFNDFIWHQYDAGNRTLNELITYYQSKLSRYKQVVTTFLSAWYEMVQPLDITYNLLKEVKAKGYRIYILSNINEDCALHLLKNAPFMKEVDGYIFSYEYHLIKPEKAIYELLFQKFQLIPNECLFLDDCKMNIDAAQQLGMYGMVYEATEEMVCKVKEILKNEGIQC